MLKKLQLTAAFKPKLILNVIENNNDIIVLKFKKLNDYLSNIAHYQMCSIMSNAQKTAELKDIKLNLINTFNKENY